jgi:hypothetical protein
MHYSWQGSLAGKCVAGAVLKVKGADRAVVSELLPDGCET